MAASSDLIASASDYVFVYRGHCVAPCVPWPFEMSHSFRNAALLVTSHWTSRERCCRQLKTSGLSSSVILLFQLSQNLTFPHLRVNASQTSVGACQLRGSCRRFLQQISWHFQLTAVASTRVFRSHQKMVRIGISPEDRRYVPGQIKKVVHMNFAVAGGGKLSGDWMTGGSRRLNGIASEQLHVRLGRVDSPESDMKASSFIRMHASSAVLCPFFF